MISIEELMSSDQIPALSTNQQGLITSVNPAFEKAYGWEVSDLIGSALTTIIPEIFHDAHNLGFSRFTADEQPTLLNQPLDLSVLTGDGNEVTAEHIIIAEKHDGEWIFAASMRPLSE